MPGALLTLPGIPAQEPSRSRECPERSKTPKKILSSCKDLSFCIIVVVQGVRNDVASKGRGPRGFDWPRGPPVQTETFGIQCVCWERPEGQGPCPRGQGGVSGQVHRSGSCLRRSEEGARREGSSGTAARVARRSSCRASPGEGARVPRGRGRRGSSSSRYRRDFSGLR